MDGCEWTIVEQDTEHPFVSGKVPGEVLLRGLEQDVLVTTLHGSLSNVNSFSITDLASCSLMFCNPALIDRFFDHIWFMSSLRNLYVDGFTISYTHGQRDIPSNLWPIRIHTLTVMRTHDHSLTFLLRHFQPTNLTLKSCYPIEFIPRCKSLTLCSIQGGTKWRLLEEALAEWDGRELIIERSQFLSEEFLEELEVRMWTTGRALWPFLRSLAILNSSNVDDEALHRFTETRRNLLVSL
ncbi:hypothetical protein NMY22_g5957 [Coprinellus aureogranulatus]|nr:hypothetical protein NMY22_g5957 [Coprinellus aureogranulatus]